MFLKDIKVVMADLKRIYGAPSWRMQNTAGRIRDKWGGIYPQF
jgi:hypothetical protein